MVPEDRPFTLHGAGCSRAVLRRLQVSGEVRRIVRGVYAHAGLEVTAEVRHDALALVLPAGAVPVGVTAAWAHGLLESCPRMESAHRDPVDLLEAAVSVGPELGLVVYDAALRLGVPHLALLGAVQPDQRGRVALADGRAADAAESRLRQAWLAADLPTPTIGHRVPGPDGERVALAHPLRAFAVSAGRLAEGDGAACRKAGWWLTEVDPDRALEAPVDLLAGHLRREFHRQLLAQVEEVSPTG